MVRKGCPRLTAGSSTESPATAPGAPRSAPPPPAEASRRWPRRGTVHAGRCSRRSEAGTSRKRSTPSGAPSTAAAPATAPWSVSGIAPATTTRWPRRGTAANGSRTPRQAQALVAIISPPCPAPPERRCAPRSAGRVAPAQYSRKGTKSNARTSTRAPAGVAGTRP